MPSAEREAPLGPLGPCCQSLFTDAKVNQSTHLRHRRGGHGPIPEVQGQTTTAADTNTVSKFGPKQSSAEGVSVTQPSLPQMKNNKGAWLRQKLMTEENHFF